MLLPVEYRRCKELDVEKIYTHRDCPGQSAKLSVKYCRKFGKLGWVFHCFSCQDSPGGMRGFQPDNDSITPKNAVVTAQNYLNPKPKVREMPIDSLPTGYTTQLDQASLKYLMKYGLTREEIKRAGFGYSPDLDRMIIPCWQDGRLTMWQARNLRDDNRPKYVNPPCPRDHLLYYPVRISQNHYEFPNTTVLVEAAISAIKVNRVAPSIALLGSALLDEVLKTIKTETIIMWLDPDKWLAAMKFSARIRSITGRKVFTLLTDCKPKCYTTGVIRELLANKLESSYDKII